VRGQDREYTLRVSLEGAVQDFVLAIPNEAFLDRRIRYQDAPEVCFLKMQRELAAAGGASPAARLTVSDNELAEYRAAHAPRAPQRRPKPPAPRDAQG
jgi:hypothetical protein